MGAQEVSRGIQVLGNIAPGAVNNDAVRAGVLTPGSIEVPELKQRIMSIWRTERGTELFKQELEASRQNLLTKAQNSVMSGVRTFEDVSHQLIIAGAIQKILVSIDTGVPIA